MKAGRLDRLITILERASTKDPVYGTTAAGWQPLTKVWAEVQDMLPSRADRVADGIALTRRPARVRMRWRDDVTQANMIEVDGRPMRIVAGPAMLGRRDGLELMVEELSTTGQQP